MATNKVFKKIRDLNPYGAQPCAVYSRFEEFMNLLLNAVKITKKNGDSINYVEERFVKRGLFELGNMGYDKITKKWFYVYGEGVNDLGNPYTLIFITANGRKAFDRIASYDDQEDGAYIINALPSYLSMAELIRYTTDFMSNCDLAMKQNLEACKTPYIVICKNEDLRYSLEHAMQEKKDGQAVIVVSDELGDSLKSVSIDVAFMVDKFAEARDTERDHLLTKLGIMTGNIDKKERVQSAEVNVTLGQATDYIYMLIDTFNKQCETYGLDFMMSYNGSMEEIYIDDNADKINDFDVNDIEKEANNND